ncbi:MAG: nuclear transport factor 2 family protein [Pyrinomonadaceae bacterium]
MMENPNIKIVESYLDAIRTKDLSKAPVAPDVYFEDPLTTPSSGVKAWTEFVSSMLPALSGVRVKEHIADGDAVATLWEADTIWGVITIFEHFRIADGRIKEAKAFFDPRPITNAT